MRVARVVGNVVSTIKDSGFHGLKLMIVAFLDENGNECDSRQIALDCADAGIGDIALVLLDGAGVNIALDNDEVVGDIIICGVVDRLDTE